MLFFDGMFNDFSVCGDRSKVPKSLKLMGVAPDFGVYKYVLVVLWRGVPWLESRD